MPNPNMPENACVSANFDATGARAFGVAVRATHRGDQLNVDGPACGESPKLTGALASTPPNVVPSANVTDTGVSVRVMPVEPTLLAKTRTPGDPVSRVVARRRRQPRWSRR